ncbi:hypothetical protein TWF730_008950 [Orbilia blumenaviensis]|uniref:Uncharacterized protein n=1 Tax=Orbilia blumenaviensis TaxID=1796055 RepID=A0AAV9V057_9PEZI
MDNKEKDSPSSSPIPPGFNRSQPYIPPHARGEGGDGDLMPGLGDPRYHPRSYSPAESSSSRPSTPHPPRQGFNRTPARQMHTRSGPPSRQDQGRQSATPSRPDRRPPTSASMSTRQDRSMDTKDWSPVKRDHFPQIAKKDPSPAKKDPSPVKKDSRPVRKDSHPVKKDPNVVKRDSAPGKKDSASVKKDVPLNKRCPSPNKKPFLPPSAFPSKAKPASTPFAPIKKDLSPGKTRARTPNKNQGSSWHPGPKPDPALHLPRKEIKNLFKTAREKKVGEASPDSKQPPKTPDTDLRPHSRLGALDLTPTRPTPIKTPVLKVSKKASRKARENTDPKLRSTPRGTSRRTRKDASKPSSPVPESQLHAPMPTAGDESSMLEGPYFLSPDGFGSSLIDPSASVSL